MKKITIELICPRCKKQKMRADLITNAISRRDNDTFICSDCGREEALIDARLINYLTTEQLARADWRP